MAGPFPALGDGSPPPTPFPAQSREPFPEGEGEKGFPEGLEGRGLLRLQGNHAAGRQGTGWWRPFSRLGGREPSPGPFPAQSREPFPQGEGEKGYSAWGRRDWTCSGGCKGSMLRDGGGLAGGAPFSRPGGTGALPQPLYRSVAEELQGEGLSSRTGGTGPVAAAREPCCGTAGERFMYTGPANAMQERFHGYSRHRRRRLYRPSSGQ